MPVMNDEDDYDDQIIYGDLGGLKLPDICLTCEENPEKTTPTKPVPTGDRTRASCVTGAHAAARPTAVDCFEIISRSLPPRLDGSSVPTGDPPFRQGDNYGR